MTLRKNEIIDMVYENIGIPKKDCGRVVDSFFEIIKDELARGNEVMISGFGKWSVIEKGSRNGRNPQTGEPMTIDARKVVSFRCSPRLRHETKGDS